MKTIAVSLALACALLTTAAGAQRVNQDRIDKELTLAEHNFYVDAGSQQRYLIGNVTNNSMTKTCDPTLTVGYLDANGNPIRNKQAHMVNLQPGGIWNFKLQASDPNVTNYVILSLRGKWYKQ